MQVEDKALYVIAAGPYLDIYIDEKYFCKLYVDSTLYIRFLEAINTDKTVDIFLANGFHLDITNQGNIFLLKRNENTVKISETEYYELCRDACIATERRAKAMDGYMEGKRKELLEAANQKLKMEERGEGI